MYKRRRRQTYSDVNIISLRKGKQNAVKMLGNSRESVSRLSPDVAPTLKYDDTAVMKALFVTVQIRNITVNSKGINFAVTPFIAHNLLAFTISKKCCTSIIVGSIT
jgi:hypothetical protein